MATPAVEEVDLSQYKNSRHESSYVKLNEYRKDGNSGWDVTLKSSDGVEIHAHKCVLASQSEYFERMFTGGFIESTQDVIQIYDISGRILNDIIDFMYTGLMVTIAKHNVEEILNAGDMFQMEDVRNECLKYYLLCLRDSNCLTIKEIADSRSMTKLSEKCLEYALERFLLLVVHQSYLDADVTHLIQLLKSDRLDPPHEEHVYRAVMIWVKYDETNRKHLLPDLLEHVRLVFTSKKFLLQEVLSDPLIHSSPECLKIVKKVMLHFNYKYGDSLSKIITNAKPRINTNKFTFDSLRYLRYYDCFETSNYSTRGTLNLVDYFKDFDFNHNFPQIEWNQNMNEINFFKSFSEMWRGNNDPEDYDYDYYNEKYDD